MRGLAGLGRGGGGGSPVSSYRVCKEGWPIALLLHILSVPQAAVVEGVVGKCTVTRVVQCIGEAMQGRGERCKVEGVVGKRTVARARQCIGEAVQGRGEWWEVICVSER